LRRTRHYRGADALSRTPDPGAGPRVYDRRQNRLTEIAAWDDKLLAEQLKELSLVDLDFSIEVIGFEMGEIDLRIASLEDASDPADDPADAIPELPARSPLSKRADSWLLGHHRVLCGNALDPADFVVLFGEERAAIVFIDPSYNVPIDGHASDLGAIHHRPFVMACGEMDKAAFVAFLAQACQNLAAFSADCPIHFICMNWRHLEELLAAAQEAYSGLENLCVWVKDNGGMGSLYRSRHELIFVFKNGRHGHRNNVQLGRFGRNRTNVWNYPGVNSFSRCGGEGNLLALHPTVKPVAMVADAMLDCSVRGDIVLDCFLGSGTSVIAAERTGPMGWSWIRLTSTQSSAAGRHRPAGVPFMPRRAAVLTTSLARRRRPMPSDDEGDYEVGYGKPPLHSRFKKGQSGNPRGRPPGAKNLSTLLNETFNEPVVITENGGRKKVSKRQASLKQLVNEAAKGNWRALKLMVDIVQDDERRTEPQTEESSFSVADEKVIAQWKARQRAKE
jgi:Family of unknown function (DUF5681)/DNA methylase